MDLFTPVIPKESWHPYFKNIQDKPNGFTCDVLVDWAKGFVDRDNKFVKEFQSTFNSSFWELYLFALFKSMSFNIDFSKDRPDFVITAPIPFLVEATVALNAQNKPPEHLRINFSPPDDLNKFNNDQIIRVANSIHSKIKKYRESYHKLNHVKNLPLCHCY
ncbi:hypothetical protein LPTSP3_g31560 [Leptospira kobayashii]|uniref:Uncharacterized protein n=1 Tax=Leptospira kobayashii TaxID=1917830 RepID=A0ABM7UME3_9LEPT|nr:hypothetical protein [Leptospira kobayashii]BDA80226.1 hypothetical protein LPTSP3_g31560 [Leptospira kobayashii]